MLLTDDQSTIDRRLPPIALLITAFNRQEKLERALASVEPELALVDIVLVDDGSEPPISIERFRHFPIHLIRLSINGGTMAASNAGLEYIYARNYEFIARLDSDDVSIKGRFATQLAYMRTHPQVGMIGGQLVHILIEGNEVRRSPYPLSDRDLRRGMHVDNMFQHSTLMMRAEIARQVGYYNPRYFAAGDYEFCWRFMDVAQVANVPEQLVVYETGSKDSVSCRRRYVQLRNALYVKVRRFNPILIHSYIGIVVTVLAALGILPRLGIVTRPAMRLLCNGPSTASTTSDKSVTW